MSQADEDVILASPVTLQNFDWRFAQLYVSTTENRPKEPSLTLSLRGHVALGESKHRGTSGRVYGINSRQVFLEIATTNCQFEPNPAMDDFVQRGKLTDRTTSATENEVSLTGEVRGTDQSSGKSMRAQAKAGWRKRGRKSVETHVDRLRVRYVAGGFLIGERSGGDPTSSAAVLDGTFLRGVWGVLRPSSPVQPYGVALKLVLPDGMLSVAPVQDEISDYLPRAKRKNRRDAFEGLKKAVAGWAIESCLRSKNAPGGYDNTRGELVLCHAEVGVDLSTAPSRANALGSGPPPESAPNIAPSDTRRRGRRKSLNTESIESTSADRGSE